MRIAFIGPPGAGKNTQARRISRFLPFHDHSFRFSTGDLVKAETEAETQVGREIRGHYERGERVPDGTILSLVLPRLRRSGGFMLANFPSAASQAAVLDEDLKERGAGTLSRVILSNARRSLAQAAEILDALGHSDSPRFYTFSEKG